MSLKKTVVLSTTIWILVIGALQAGLNLDLFRKADRANHQFKVGFLPVT